MPRVALHTLGCKLNYAETATIGQQFLDRGFELVEFGQPADVCVINTCSVTERADRECRQLIRRALRRGGNPFVVVTGCYAQLAPEAVASINGVDLVLGSREKFDLFAYADTFAKSGAPRVHVGEVGDLDAFGPAFSRDASDRTRAYLKVQDGCDYSCSFCTIPLARGGSRSQPLEECLHQAAHLVTQGFKEIVLTGVNVGDYGTATGASLLTLLQGLARLEGLERIRISSIEPNLLTTELIELAAAEKKLCAHFHIPLQSGTDSVLRRMRRRYTTGEYRDLLQAIRSRLPEAGIGADVITGFPGETEAEYEATHRFLAELPISYLHVFTYSERPNTPAASMGAQVPPEVRHRRNDALRILSEKKRQAFASRMVGRTLPVLAESDVQDGYRSALTENYVRVMIPAESCRENTIVRVSINGAREGRCVGTVVDGEGRA
jgi:threonylcarbamoyladenosine tRNA methylthiotransferase MtaB